MPSCSRCNQLVDSQDITCPHCGNQLKAFGHPGIPLYQAKDTTYLCDRCTYHEDDSCNFPQRPYAKTCTLFHDKSLPLVDEWQLSPPKYTGVKAVQFWLSANRGLALIALIIIISVLIAVIS
ncbi:MAG: zinc ribbon domain-containing protein [Xenococcaceae cyanobacterium]